jgi:hypothetical protein
MIELKIANVLFGIGVLISFLTTNVGATSGSPSFWRVWLKPQKPRMAGAMPGCLAGT